MPLPPDKAPAALRTANAEISIRLSLPDWETVIDALDTARAQYYGLAGPNSPEVGDIDYVEHFIRKAVMQKAPVRMPQQPTGE
jgi:hypothetical protein